MGSPSHGSGAERTRRVHEQRVVADLGDLALESDDLEALFREATRAVAETLEAESAELLESFPGGDGFLLRAGLGWDDGSVGTATIPAGEDSQAGYTLVADGPVIAADLAADGRFDRPELFREREFESGASVVVGSSEAPWGVLCVHASEAAAFDDGDVAFLRSVANVLASAIDRHRADRRRDAEETLNEKLVETSPIGITIVDRDGEMRFANDRAEEIFGRSRERIDDLEFDDTSWDEVGPDGESLECEELPFPRIVESGEPLYDQVSGVLRPDGERVWISVNGAPLYDGRGEIEGVVFAIEDVTDQFHRDRELERYETVIETAHDGIYVLDDDRRFELVNDSFAELTAFSREELQGRHASDVFGEAFAVIESVQRDAASGSKSPTFEGEINSGPDETRTVENRFTILADDDGEKRVGVVRDVSERERLEEQLRAERDMKDEILETSPIGITLLDADGRHVFANDRAEELFGRSLEDLQDYAHDDDRWGHVDEDGDPLSDEDLPFRTVRETWEPVYDEVIGIEQPDGTRVWLSAHCGPLFDADGNFDGAVFALRDITERKRLESELERTFERVSDAFHAIDTEWNFTYLNEQAEQLLGVEDHDLIGANIWEEFPSAVGSTFEREYRRAMESQETVRFEEYSPVVDGWVEVNVYPSKTGLSVYFRDISERKARENQLKRFESIVETVNDGVYVTDGDGHFVFVNDAFVSMSEHSREELLGSHGSLFFDEQFVDTDQAEWDALVEGEIDSVEFETTITGPDGTTRNVQNKFVPLEMGGETGRVGVTRDVTERKEYQRRLEESNERLEQFAYAASHDLQEPLRMVSSYLRLIEDRYADDLDEDGREFLEFAVDGADRMREMIDGLLDYSRVDTQGEPLEPLELADVFDDVRRDLELRIQETGAEITADSLPRVVGDGNQLRQLFQNLLSNALEYSGEGTPRIDVSVERRGEMWEISVSDEGIGIDPADQERIFGVFQRLHAIDEGGGSGIGLALCERIVQRHGGEIRVDSAPGEGATFSVTLPAADDS